MRLTANVQRSGPQHVGHSSRPPHLFWYELVLFVRHHFHSCGSLDKYLSGRGCQRLHFTAGNAGIVRVPLEVRCDTWIVKLNLPKSDQSDRNTVLVPEDKVPCCTWRKMAGVLLRETSLRELWRHIPSRQACVMCPARVTSVCACVCVGGWGGGGVLFLIHTDHSSC